VVPFLDMVCLILRSHVGTDVWPVPVRADAVVMLRGEGGQIRGHCEVSTGWYCLPCHEIPLVLWHVFDERALFLKKIALTCSRACWLFPLQLSSEETPLP